MSRRTTISYQGRTVPGTSMDFTQPSEPWIDYKLENGGVVKVRLVVGDIVVTDETNESGLPLVVAQSNILMQYVPPADPVTKQ